MRASFRDDKPLHWMRVHDLPDFVYFNHSIHVKKGMGCETCHGRVDQMPLMLQKSSLQMEWCLELPPQPREVRPAARRDQRRWATSRPVRSRCIGPQLVKEYGINARITSCSTCHR